MKEPLPAEPPPSMVAYELSPGKVLFVLAHAAPRVDALSPAEQEVLVFLLRGWSIADVAAARGTSPRTTANQIASIYRKAGVGSRATLAAKLLGG